MTLTEIIVGFVAAGGGGAIIAFAIARSFGEKWLDSKFAGRLQDLRHEHERQMELVRLQSSQSLDRFTRLSEREFEVTAEAWSLVTDAHVRTMRALPGLRQSNDFSQLPDNLAKIAASQSGLEEWEIEELLKREKDQRNRYFHERRALHEIADAKFAIGKANGHIVRNALFLDQKIHGELDEFLDWAWKAMIAWEIVREVRQEGLGLGGLDGLKRDDEDFRKGADKRMKELEVALRGRFWPGQDE